jgi:hypothetical protein
MEPMGVEIAAATVVYNGYKSANGSLWLVNSRWPSVLARGMAMKTALATSIPLYEYTACTEPFGSANFNRCEDDCIGQY